MTFSAAELSSRAVDELRSDAPGAWKTALVAIAVALTETCPKCEEKK